MWTVWQQLLCLLIFYITCVCGFPQQTLEKEKELLHHVTTQTVEELGGSKRAIMIGSRRCGKNIVRPLSLTSHNLTKRARMLNLDEIHKDLHGTDGTEGTSALRQTSLLDKPRNTWFDRLDKCCHEHDECPRVISARSEGFGYSNNMDYNVFDCQCDDLFSDCLKTADSYTADAVGTLYFNTLKPPCVDFPAVTQKVTEATSHPAALTSQRVSSVAQPLAERVSLITDTGENDIKANGIVTNKPVERLAQHYQTVSDE